MKKFLSLVLAGVLAFGLTACGGGSGDSKKPDESTQKEESAEGTDEGKEGESAEGAEGSEVNASDLKVALLISGNLGDMSFNDSANVGVTRAADELGVTARVVECNSDSSKYEPTLLEFSDDGYDLIIASTNFIEFIEKYADDYPDTTYVLFDGEIDYSKGDLKNVNCILYKANEASFLGGYVAAELTKSGAEGMNDDKVIGFLGGMDQPVINDFLVGFIQGAQHADPDVKVASVYSNSFSDSAKGKELTISMLGQGADVCFNVAGGAGIGLIEACVEKGVKVIGVDSDQALIFEESKPEFSNQIPTSVLKNVGDSLYRSIELYTKGELTMGTEYLGIAEGGVGLATNKYYEEQVPQEIRDKVTELQEKILSGEIEVNTALGKPVDEVAAIISEARP